MGVESVIGKKSHLVGKGSPYNSALSCYSQTLTVLPNSLVSWTEQLELTPLYHKNKIIREPSKEKHFLLTDLLDFYRGVQSYSWGNIHKLPGAFSEIMHEQRLP